MTSNKKPKATIKNKYAGLKLEVNTYAPFDYKAINTRKTNKKQHFNLALIRRGEGSTDTENEILEDIPNDEEIEELEDEEE